MRFLILALAISMQAHADESDFCNAMDDLANISARLEKTEAVAKISGVMDLANARMLGERFAGAWADVQAAEFVPPKGFACEGISAKDKARIGKYLKRAIRK